MSESHGRRSHNPANDSERDALPSRAATPGTDGSQTPSRTNRFKKRVKGTFRNIKNDLKRTFEALLSVDSSMNQGGLPDALAAASGSDSEATQPGTETISFAALADTIHEASSSIRATVTSASHPTTSSNITDVSPGAPVLAAEDAKASSRSKVLAIAKGTLKTTLGIAATLAPEPFKGPVEAVLKIVGVFEKVSSNKEGVALKKRCDLIGESILNAVMGKDERLLSEDLQDSVGQLAGGMWNVLKDVKIQTSTGGAMYLLAEDDAEVVRVANRKLDGLLQCFWIENHIAGTIILEEILLAVKDQKECMGGFSQKIDECVKEEKIALENILLALTNQKEQAQGLSQTVNQHVKRFTLNQLKWVSGAAYDSQGVASKITTCFEGTRFTLLAKIGCWMSGTQTNGTASPPLYVLDGIAGIGKSTVALTVAQRAASLNSLGASFFFSQDQVERARSLGFVQTIAFQLAHYDASYGEAIAVAIDSTPDALDKVLSQQFNLIVSQPLTPLLRQRVTPLVLVIDALDECAESDALELLKLIISSVCQLPNVKVFLTTRPELDLRRKYMGTRAHIFHLQEIEDLIVEHDVKLYVDYFLSPAKVQEALDVQWQPTQEAKDKLV